ncbi:hypothetical protein HDU91_005664 [Kappamyces sp. JEL0680]|nr:hypothetical protein HDU91_005664 [Kappamyces sp. JEL0680]
MSINPHEDYAHTLRLLLNMGFSDMEANRRAVRACNGLLQNSIEYLTNGGQAVDQPKTLSTQFGAHAATATRRSTPQSVARPTFPKLNQDQASKVLQCGGMGFTDEGKIRHALTKSKWVVEAAIDLLLRDEGLESDFSSYEKNQAPGVSQHATGFSGTGWSDLAPANDTTPGHRPGPVPSSYESAHNPFGTSGSFGSQSWVGRSMIDR